MHIRPYQPSDIDQIASLFYQTVHTVCAADYTPDQLAVWATGQIDKVGWDRSFRSHYTLVAVSGDTVIGFGDIDATGYLDRLYVHHRYQHQGIATALCDQLERYYPVAAITTHASITARPFFERRGYRVLRAQQVERGGLTLQNFVMQKDL